MNSHIPDRGDVLQAIGNTRGLPLHMQRALKVDRSFDMIRPPRSGDRISVRQERGQSFDEYVRSGPRKPDRKRKVIYLMPLGEFTEGSSPSMELLRECAEANFLLDAKILPGEGACESLFTTRIDPATGGVQVRSRDVLAYLKRHLPEDAFCMLGITMEDLYLSKGWNFVFGQASPSTGTCVFSFARYSPAFTGNDRKEVFGELLQRRCCKVLVHETAHMFSLPHCTFFRCIMNSSDHLAESDARPLHICPVCLRKLAYSAGFNVVERYQRLFYFLKSAGFDHEALWVTRRLEQILGS